MTRKSKLLIALAVTVLTLLPNVWYLASGCDSIWLMLATLPPFGAAVLGFLLYALYGNPNAAAAAS